MLLVLMAVVILGCDEEKPVVEKVSPVVEEVKQEAKVVKEGIKMVKIETSMGDIVVELNEEKAPITVANFLSYVEEGFFDGLIFHRVMSGFMIQGGGITADMRRKPPHAPIVNEASNGLKNDRGTIAMGQIPGNQHSATSQFFINHKDNFNLNYIAGRAPGYAVFGKVVDGMDVVDAIAAVKTGPALMEGRHTVQDVPVEQVIIKSVTVVTE
jgi:cyclophilin family peptidyl-prolyl cis-trans isomerase